MEVLYGDQVLLCPLSYEHVFQYLISFTQQVRHILHVPDLEAEYRYLSNRLIYQKEQAIFFYCIFDKATDILVGAIEIRGAEFPGQLYTWLHPDYWGKYYFQEALLLLATYYFSVTKQFYFTARVDADNLRSYHALKKVGFADYAIVKGPYAEQYELMFIDHA
jgi:RimJ/RimL family protein N-acetyltransferase